MNTFLHTKFEFNFNKFIKNNTNIIIALSSGQDSLCLLKLLKDYINKKSFKLHAVYIDHQWKNDSQYHTKHILNIMQSEIIPLTIYQIKYLCLSETESRKIRYKILIKHAIKNQCNIIITGHNQNDQIETFLHNLIRGTSLNGITSLTLSKQLNYKLSIIRPLINFTKSEITWFCRFFYLPIWSDITNYNFHLKRNRLRYELIPYLHNYFNRNIEHTLTSFIKLCEYDNEYIKENTLKLYIKSKHKQFISLNIQMLSKQHYILQKRVLKLYFHYHFHKQINKKIISYILKLPSITKNRILYCNKLTIHYYYGWIYSTLH